MSSWGVDWGWGGGLSCPPLSFVLFCLSTPLMFGLTWILVPLPLSLKDGGSPLGWGGGVLAGLGVHRGAPLRKTPAHQQIPAQTWARSLIGSKNSCRTTKDKSQDESPASPLCRRRDPPSSEFPNSASFPQTALPQTREQTSAGQAHIGVT